MKEYKIVVAGVEYNMDAIKSGEIEQELFAAPGVGNTCRAVLNLSFWPREAPPRNAEIRAYVREDGGDWEQLGQLWIDQRSDGNGRLDVVAYDAMGKAEALWKPGDGLSFPAGMEAAARAIAADMGTELDQRCVFEPSYTVDAPPLGAYTMREALGFIAAAHGGNWIVTAAGKLLLTPLFASMPPETHFLVEEDGGAILFGDVRILL